jgi:hypothetical protein
MSSSSDSHWAAVYRQGPRLGPPLVVTDEIAAAYRAAIAGCRGPGLLLGVTPRLTDFAEDVTAVERNQSVIAARWPGDTPRRRAILADWREMAFPPGSFSACVGDGSFNALASMSEASDVLARVANALAPAGRVAVRTYLTPDEGETVAAVFAAARAREIASFSAFKWRLAMALVGERGDPAIPVAVIHARFAATAPDRDTFAAESGMAREEIEAIEIYRGSPEIYCFPTAAELRAAVPPALRFLAFAPSGSYELAERCPIAIMERT